MANPKDANRVAEFSSTVGTGTMTLAGSLTKHDTFAEAYGASANVEVWYGIHHDDEDIDEFELGIGTFLASQNKLQRDTVHRSSDGASKVSFSVGTKVIYVAVPAEGVRLIRASRSSDVVLELRGTSGQSGNILSTYNGSGALALQIDSAGQLRLAPGTEESARIPMNSSGAAFVGVHRTLLGTPTDPGIRFRMGGSGGGDGLIQWSGGDVGWVQLQPNSGQLRASQGTGSGGGAGSGLGITLVNGLKLLGNNAEVDGVAVGHIGFDCGGGSGASIWDMGPANNIGSATHTVRVGRRSGANTQVEFIVTLPGTTTPRVTLDSTGRVTGFYGDFGDYNIGFGPAGVADSTLISSKENVAFTARSGIEGNGAFFFRDFSGTLLARIDDTGATIAAADTLITRQKGDGRYATISSARFKEQIDDPGNLAGVFPRLRPQRFIWGGEVPASDERRGTVGIGFIAEDVEEVMPAAARYVRVGEGKNARLILQGLDPLAIAAVLHAKIAEHDERIAALETRPAATRKRKT